MSTYLTCYSGVGSVTGANFLLEIAGKKVLIDCGLIQGERVAQQENRKDFEYNPAEIDILFVTHAHLDHVGRIPKLVKDGFAGVIY
ncbi:MAG: MBL fold metallo-hydrolase, partial [Patescibacteria group bacterium]